MQSRLDWVASVYKLLEERHDIMFTNMDDLRFVLSELYNYGCELSGLSKAVMLGNGYVSSGLNGISLGEVGAIYTITGGYHGSPIKYEQIAPDDDEDFDISEDEFLSNFSVLMC